MAYNDAAEGQQRVRELEMEVADLRRCLERGVTVASQEHIQNLVERRVLNRERDTLKEQLQRTKTELGGDVWLAFSEAKRLAGTNMELSETLDQRDEEIARLKEQMKALNAAHTAALDKLDELSEERVQLLSAQANQKLQIATLRQAVSAAHMRQWREETARDMPQRAQSVEPPKTETLGIPWEEGVEIPTDPPTPHIKTPNMAKGTPLPSLLSHRKKNTTRADDYKFKDPRVPVEPTLSRKKKARVGAAF
eukprot:TRINITY_DN5409_c0_g1_i1.p1 TRINITY_DN5409_c0_g1~~TRINITY_DN5409_c0_g1_i1.p1  ORF type:complete len:277 (+),score=95.72 TRINITY_DN5409_c0_g1_i1:81-833(+)